MRELIGTLSNEDLVIEISTISRLTKEEVITLANTLQSRHNVDLHYALYMVWLDKALKAGININKINEGRLYADDPFIVALAELHKGITLDKVIQMLADLSKE